MVEFQFEGEFVYMWNQKPLRMKWLTFFFEFHVVRFAGEGTERSVKYVFIFF
jgi:hypothetical protein